jgi:hypothetical protein
MDLGLAAKAAKDLQLEPGQAFNEQNDFMQIALVTGRKMSGETSSPIDPYAELAQLLNVERASDIRIKPLPEKVVLPTITPNLGRTLEFGIQDLSLKKVQLDLRYENTAILGPSKSGRSTALLTIASQLTQSSESIWVVGSNNSTLQTLGITNSAYGKAPNVKPLLERLAEVAQSDDAGDHILIFDDADLIDDKDIHPLLKTIVSSEVRCIASASSFDNYQNPFIQDIKKARQLILLLPTEDRKFQELTGKRTPVRPGTAIVPGRAVLFSKGEASVIQILEVETAPANDAI